MALSTVSVRIKRKCAGSGHLPAVVATYEAFWSGFSSGLKHANYNVFFN